jgi:hypothetical protein
MHNEADGDVFEFVAARTVERILHSPLLDAGPEDEKAIKDRLADIQRAADTVVRPIYILAQWKPPIIWRPRHGNRFLLRWFLRHP